MTCDSHLKENDLIFVLIEKVKQNETKQKLINVKKRKNCLWNENDNILNE